MPTIIKKHWPLVRKIWPIPLSSYYYYWIFKMLNIKHVSEIGKIDMLLYKSQLVAAHKIREYIILFHNRRTTTL
jgi:hypothetical protein